MALPGNLRITIVPAALVAGPNGGASIAPWRSLLQLPSQL